MCCIKLTRLGQSGNRIHNAICCFRILADTVVELVDVVAESWGILADCGGMSVDNILKFCRMLADIVVKASEEITCTFHIYIRVVLGVVGTEMKRESIYKHIQYLSS